ncbi:MAG: WbqC family protein [Bacteroidales bacterium]|nr:WbqC family protein [Bacteroidales bacterium]
MDDVDKSKPKRVAIMQPYFFPYIGYYQLVAAVDVFVFYDDVSFIKGGWINRNRILSNNKNGYFTLPLQKSSSNRRINEILSLDYSNNLDKTIKQTYSKAPYFHDVYPLLRSIIFSEENSISEISRRSITNVIKHLGLEKEFLVSSEARVYQKMLE